MTITTERWTGKAGDNDFLNATNWSLRVVPQASVTTIIAGNYDVQLGASATINSLSVGAGATLEVENNALLNLLAASTNRGTIDLSGVISGGLTNYGTVDASQGTIFGFTNVGTVEVKDNSSLTLASVTNKNANTLSGGTWDVGNSHLTLSDGGAIQILSGKSLVELSGSGHITSGENDIALTQSLTAIDAGSTLSLSGATFAHENPLDVKGAVRLTDGTLGDFYSSTTIEKGGLLSGGGYVEGNLTVYGTVRADTVQEPLSLDGHVTLAGTLAGSQQVEISTELDVVTGARITASSIFVTELATLKIENSTTLSSDLNLAGTLQIDGRSLGLAGDTMVQGIIQGSGYILNTGTLEAQGSGSIYTSLLNRGTVDLRYGELFFGGAVSGAGTFNLHDGGTLQFGSSVSSTAHVALDGGALVLGDARDFHGILTGAASGSTIDLIGFNDATEKLTYTADADGVGGTLRVSDGHNVAMLHFDETVDLKGFSHMDDGSSKGSIIHYTDFHNMIG